MITITDLSSIAVIGGNGAPPDGGSSAFLYARPILRSGDLLLLVHHYEENGVPTGTEVWDLEEEVSDYGAFSIHNPLAFVPHGMFWIFRKSFAELMPGVLTNNGFMVHAGSHLDLPEFAADIFLVNEKLAAKYRADWIEKSFEKAWAAAQTEDWGLVRRYADIAFVSMPGFDATICALFNIACEKLGDTKRAVWEIDVARRSGGDALADEVLKRKARICESLATKGQV